MCDVRDVRRARWPKRPLSSTGQSTGSPPAGRWAELSTDAYGYLLAHNESFTGLAAFRPGIDALAVHWPGAQASTQDQRALGHLVSGNYFQMMGVDAAAGRLLEPTDDVPNARPTVVISYAYWQQRLQGTPSAIGHAVDLNGTSFTVVGVAARGFFGERMYEQPPDFWIPLAFQPAIMQRPSWLDRTDLLSGAGLLARTFINLEDQSLGFDAEHVLLVRIDPRLAGLKVGELEGTYRQLMDRLNALPGVTSASTAFYTPMSGYNETLSATIEGYTPRPDEGLDVNFDTIAPRFFQTLGIPLLRGRGVGPQDTATSPQVVVVNQAFVDRYFPGQNPIGRHVSIGHTSYPPPSTLPQQIVGVVGNVRYDDPATPAKPMAYIPLSQDPSRFAGELVIRTKGDPSASVAEVRQAVRDIDSALPVVSVRTLEEQVGRQLSQQHLVAVLSGLFSLLALVLAAVGLAGVLAYWVRRQTAEIGVRLALGARPESIVRLIISRGMTIALAGMGAGLVVALASTRLLASSLYGVTPQDPATIGAICVLVVCVALLACYIPARAGAKIDPVVALREQ